MLKSKYYFNLPAVLWCFGCYLVIVAESSLTADDETSAVASFYGGGVGATSLGGGGGGAASQLVSFSNNNGGGGGGGGGFESSSSSSSSNANNNNNGDEFLRPSMKVRKELFANGDAAGGGNGGNGNNGNGEAGLTDDLVQECLKAVNNCTNTQDTLLIHVALFLLSDRKWRPVPNSSQVQYVLSGCDKYEKFIQCVELHTNAAYGSQECFELSGFSDSFGFRWHRCNRFKRWVGMKKPSRRHSRSRYYFRRHGRMRI